MKGECLHRRSDGHDVASTSGTGPRIFARETVGVPLEAGVISWLIWKEFGPNHAARPAEIEPKEIRGVPYR